MIEFSINCTGKCEGCKYMDLDYDVSDIYSNDLVAARDVSVYCKNQGLCDHLERYLATEQIIRRNERWKRG